MAAISEPNAPPVSGRFMRWVSLRAYGLVTSALFGALTPPRRMRARFERFASVSRVALRRRFPRAVFGDHRAGELEVESVRAVDAPACVLLHLHGGGFFMGSPSSYRNRAMRLSYRLDAEVFVPAYRLAPSIRSPPPSTTRSPRSGSPGGSVRARRCS